jgi:serine/threonine-protein kinase
MGTPAFMAPEAALGMAEPRSDLYALGCVGYWLVTGRRLFESNDPIEAIERHRREPPDSPSRGTEHEVSAEFDAVILACLEKDPARRPTDAAALAARLAALPGPVWDQEQARAWWRNHQEDSFAPTS